MTMADEKTKYFLYSRKSSEQEDRQVLSIDSQTKELGEIVKREKLQIVDILPESHSAKSPGRPVFDEMIRRIEDGEANGILAWSPNRLSRNSVDTGRIIYLFDKGILLEVRTPSQVFCNTPNDKFLLSLFCSQAKLENDNKGEDVKRGLRRKAEIGYRPGFVPPGYLNTPDREKGYKTTTNDPERFNLIRKMWDLMLTGDYTPPRILEIANKEWGYRTLRRKKLGGQPLSRSGIYKIFSNPFYYGTFEYPEGSGNWYEGGHEAMITENEYDTVQIMLGRKGNPRSKKYNFAFRGPLFCEECGAMVTAEHKYKKQKNGKVRHYIYYHCTKRRGKCSQGSIEEKQLEKQIVALLNRIDIPHDFYEWAMDVLRKQNREEFGKRRGMLINLQKQYDACVKRIDGLIDMRANGEITEDEFSVKKLGLVGEKERLQRLINDNDNGIDDWIEKAERVFSFAEHAVERFQTGTPEDKRGILLSLGSNLTLKDRKLCVRLEKPLIFVEEAALEVRRISEMFEPLENRVGTAQIRGEYEKSSTLLRGSDSNRQPTR